MNYLLSHHFILILCQTNIIRAWDFKYYIKPILLCPAMNTKMWEHPFTEKQLNILSSDPLNMMIINPLSQRLECGDIGMISHHNIQ
jgi:phosphopantothenoylcysteine decarboxylase